MPNIMSESDGNFSENTVFIKKEVEDIADRYSYENLELDNSMEIKSEEGDDTDIKSEPIEDSDIQLSDSVDRENEEWATKKKRKKQQKHLGIVVGEPFSIFSTASDNESGEEDTEAGVVNVTASNHVDLENADEFLPKVAEDVKITKEEVGDFDLVDSVGNVNIEVKIGIDEEIEEETSCKILKMVSLVIFIFAC